MNRVWSTDTRNCVFLSVLRKIQICVCVCVGRQIMELFSVIPPVSFQVWLESRWLALM